MKLKANYRKYLREHSEERIEKIVCDYMYKHKKSKKCLDKTKELESLLIDRLGENKHLFLEYEEATNKLFGLTFTRAYFQGFVDALKFTSRS